MDTGIFDSGKLLADLAPSDADIDGRRPAERDYDEVVFSPAFRRLARKTQIFPLLRDDSAHNRLMHSLECASVARSLGRSAGKIFQEKVRDVHAGDIATATATAALVHDIGNPPFGHSGELAMQAAFAEDEVWYDDLGVSSTFLEELRKIDGNVIGLRMLLGGYSLRSTTIAASVKRPWRIEDGGPFSVLESSASQFATHAKLAGVPEIGTGWPRHPLSYLMEAADDICYLVMDVVDAAKLSLISEHECCSQLSRITGEKDLRVEEQRDWAIGRLVAESSMVFEDQLRQIMQGTFRRELLDVVDAKIGGCIAELRSWERENVYLHEPILQVEAAGFEVLSYLTRVFCQAAAQKSPRGVIKKVKQLLPKALRSRVEGLGTVDSKVLEGVMHVAGMTDRYALETFQVLKGIKLPHALP